MQKIKNTFSAPLLVLVIYVLLIASRFIDLDSLQMKDNVYLSMIILQVLIFILPGVFYCKLKDIDAKALRISPLSPRKIWFVLSSFGALIFGSTLINTATFYIFGNESQYSLYETFSPAGSTQLINVVYIIIAFAVLPTITEEFIFRGVLLSEYSEYGVGTAILISSLTFAMLHFNLSHFAVYFYCGIITAYTMYVTQSLIAPMLLHFLNNVYSIFLESVLWDVIKSPNSLIFFLFVIATLFIVFLVLSFNGAENILYTAGMMGKDSPPEATKREGGIKLLIEALISPSFLGCVIFFLIVTLIIK